MYIFLTNEFNKSTAKKKTKQKIKTKTRGKFSKNSDGFIETSDWKLVLDPKGNRWASRLFYCEIKCTPWVRISKLKFDSVTREVTDAGDGKNIGLHWLKKEMPRGCNSIVFLFFFLDWKQIDGGSWSAMRA